MSKVSKSVVSELTKSTQFGANKLNFHKENLDKNLAFIKNDKASSQIRSFIDIIINNGINFSVIFDTYIDLSNKKIKSIKISGYMANLNKKKSIDSKLYLKAGNELYFDIQLLKNTGVIINLGMTYKSIIDKSIYKDFKKKLIEKKYEMESEEVIDFLNHLIDSSQSLKRSKNLNEIVE